MKPERIVHLGLGAFFRAHQGFYTAKAADSAGWGIVAYTGRDPKQAELMSAQNCQYTLITRSASGDSFEVIGSVVRAEPGSNVEDFISTVANPATAVITLTITEAGYQVFGQELADSALGRLAIALKQRLSNNGEPLALVSCDNLPANGEVLKRALQQLGADFGQEFLDYLDRCSFVTTSIDRITPQTTAEDEALVQQSTGFADKTPVVTEPFSDWVLSGDFPLGRPAWETAGARFVADIEPFENRKLWLLNGAHSLIAFLGSHLGHQTVDQAIADPEVFNGVNLFWDEAANHLDQELLNVSGYRNALLDRFSNPRIGYRLAQIAQQGLSKISVRIVPVAIAELNAGRHPAGALEALAAWICFVRSGAEIVDARKSEIDSASTPAELVALISELSVWPEFVEQVLDRALQLENQLVTR